ncbi:YveK family protein [Metaplanococcus flavidus]|uniref:YveK family protein n=1 Tax=Metaplanococcus flavidus TaxID=569883 RepID=A0ABW3LDU6_9BACL
MIEEISLRQIVGIIRKKMVLILILTVLAISIAAVISIYILTPTYQTSTQLLVNQEQTVDGQLTNQGIQTDLQLINTYSNIIKSPVILTQVIEQLNLDTTAKELVGSITVNSSADSQMIDIVVEHEQPATAVLLANTTAEVFESEIQNLMNVDNVKIMWPAEETENPVPVKPNLVVNMAAAGAAGLILGIGLSFILAYMDTTIKSEEDIEKYLQLPLLGIISKIAEVKAEKELSPKSLKEKRLTAYDEK